MGKGLLFFCCSCCILVLTIINLSVGPIISGTLGTSLGTLPCEKYKDEKETAEDNAKKANTKLSDERDKYYQSQIDCCTRLKGIHDMEYTAFIFDIVIGFICGLIGLFHLFDLKKDFVSKTGLIGFICGVIGFVFTFVYVIFNGIVFTSKYSGEVERDENGAYAERVDGKSNYYKCLYSDDSGDRYGGRAKVSDLNKKQYNYKKDFYSGVSTTCITSSYSYKCTGHVSDPEFDDASSKYSTCKFLYYIAETGITNKDKFDRFLTTLILSLIVCLANIGLALFGFLLFRTPSDF